MNGIENITKRILDDAENTAKEIKAQAEIEAQAIRENFAQKAKTDASEILSKGKKLSDERCERLSGVAGLEARKMLLRTKQQMIDVAFREAITKLCAQEGEEYVNMLTSLILSATISGNEEIIMSEEDRAKYGKSVVSLANKKLSEGDGILKTAGKLIRGEGLTLSDETREIEGGLILKEGTLEIDASFKTIISQLRDELAGDVANILFG